jgi:hypothetical protein
MSAGAGQAVHQARKSRALPAALVALGLGLTGATAGPVPAAHAERGSRVCGVFHSSTRDDLYGTGLVVEIAKDDPNGDTCSKKADYMRAHYGSAYPGSSAVRSFSMVTCETFAARIGYRGGDICFDMEVNRIYTYTSQFDRLHPSQAGVRFWHD